MRTRNAIMFGIAFVCAGIAALLANSWLQKQNPQTVVVQKEVKNPQLGNLVVAANDLEFGVELSRKNLKIIPWPKKAIPSEAFTSINAVLSAGKRSALSRFAKDEPILKNKITKPNRKASLSTVISDNKRAITIRVNDVAGVAGFVQPGDRVDVMLIRSPTRAGPQNPNNTPFADVLLQNVRVLGLDQAATRQQKINPAKAVTLEVNTFQAQKVLLGSSIGQLSLVLRRDGWDEQEVTRRVGLSDIIQGNTSDDTLNSPNVGVVRAGKRQEYSVPYDIESQIFSNFGDDTVNNN